MWEVDVEDGHTLHLVVRQPLPPSETLPNRPGSDCFHVSVLLNKYSIIDYTELNIFYKPCCISLESKTCYSHLL